MFPVLVPVRRNPLSIELASGLAILGGAFVVLEAFVVLDASSLFLPGLLCGALIVGLGAAATYRSTNRQVLGALVVLFGFGSLYSGGGFYLGAILAILGGILIVNSRASGTTNFGPSTFSADALGPPCPKCGRHIPTWTSKCPYCGFPEDD